MQAFPNTLAAFIDKANCRIVKPWIQYLQQFTQAPGKFNPVSVGISPFSYKSAEPGFVYIKNGTITTVTLTRGSLTLDVTGLVLIPVGVSDTVVITYTGVPTVYFIPSFGAATTS